MKTMNKCLIAGVSLALALPFAASAQSDNVSYCNALAAKIRATRSSNMSNAATPVAMSQCSKGDEAAAKAIPVLEKELTDDKIALPPRK